MTKMMRFLFRLFVIAACCGVVFYATREYYDGKTTVIEKVVPQEKIVEKEKVMTGDIIQESLNDIGLMVTQKYTYTEVETYSKDLKINDTHIPFSTTAFIYSYDGTIMAGIDFSEIVVEKDDAKKSIHISIPKAIIISSELDTNSFVLYDESRSIINPISVEDVNESLCDLKANAEARAIERGLLDSANKNAEMMIYNFVAVTCGLSDFEIVII